MVVEILFYTQLIECELTYAQICLVILMKDWFVLRDRDSDRERKEKERRRLFCFILGVRRECVSCNISTNSDCSIRDFFLIQFILWSLKQLLLRKIFHRNKFEFL